MRVAFISANREQLPDAVIPLGLLCVMGSLPTRHPRALIDLCFESDPLAVLRERLTAFDPDLVAVGVRNLQSNLYDGTQDNLRAYTELGRAIREASDAPIVIGGSAVSVVPEAMMDTLGADYAIAGEGERAFQGLVAALESAKAEPAALASSGIARLYFRDRGLIRRTRASPEWLDLDRLPWPARDQLDPRYASRFGIESVQTKRGCGMTCSYCTYPRIEGAAVRARNPSLVVDELLSLQGSAQAPRHVFIVDSVFNRPRSHAKAICRQMVARGFTLPWTCYINPLGFDAELADLMVNAGCAGVEIGSDSGCDHVLAGLRKGFDTARITEVHELCRAAGLRDCHTFILGTLRETMADVEQTFEFASRLDPFAAIFMVWVDDDESATAAEGARRRRFRCAIERRLAALAREHPRWIAPALQHNFGSRLFDLLRRRGCAGPLWQSIDLAAPASAAPGAAASRPPA